MIVIATGKDIILLLFTVTPWSVIIPTLTGVD